MSILSPAVTVVMPAYNAESTVEMSARSVLDQEFTDFELIIVNDCSTDGTREVLTLLESADPRVRVLDNETNLKMGPSRNRAIAEARGRYLAFIDADDSYEPDFLMRLYRAITENKADIAQARFRYIFDERDYPAGGPAGIVDGVQASIRTDVINDRLPYLTPHPWNKLFDARLFANLDQGYLPIIHEDVEILPRLIRHVSRFVCIPEVLYNYDKRESVITATNRRLTLDEVSFRMASIEQMFDSSLDPEFVAKVQAWGIYPAAPVSNLGNALKILLETQDGYSPQERNVIVAIAEEHVSRIAAKCQGSPFSGKVEEKWEWFTTRFRVENSGARGRRWPAKMVTFRRGFTAFVERNLTALDRIVPKKKGLYVYNSWAKYTSHTLDSPRMVYEYNRRVGGTENVVIIAGDKPAADPENGTVFPARTSLRGLWTMLRCEKLFIPGSIHSTYGFRRLLGHPRREIVQLWHGIALKKVGLQVSDLERWWPREAQRYAFVAASSVTDAETMTRAFASSEETRVIDTGLPRHDILAWPLGELPADLRAMDDQILDRLGGRPLVLYAPTWRQKRGTPLPLSDNDITRLEQFARDRDFVFALRYHPHLLTMGQKVVSTISDHLIVLDDIPEANMILRRADVLVTDYSSIYLDYLLLERPVVLYQPDAEDYRRDRGLNFTPDQYTPAGVTCESIDELIAALDKVITGDWEPDETYQQVRARFHSHPLDGRASERVMSHINRRKDA